jgi:hypothetical protein
MLLIQMSFVAALQMAFWGNPMTSASPNIDYFLSADDMEFPLRTRLLPDSEPYSEQVILIEGQGIWYYQPESFAITLERAGLSLANVEPFDDFIREQFDIPQVAFLFLCPQSVFKMHPLFDHIIARIVHGSDNIYVAVTGGRRKHWTKVYTERLQRAVGNHTAAWGRMRILSRVTSDQILSLMNIADVILHPFPFDGSRTSADSLAIGKPFITLPSEHLRGRMGFMYYKTMNIPDLVARNSSHYVQIALKLASDRQYMEDISEKIRDRTHLIWEDMETSYHFTEFFSQLLGVPRLSWEQFVAQADRNVTEETRLRDIRRQNRKAFEKSWGEERYMLSADGSGKLLSMLNVGEILPIFNDWKRPDEQKPQRPSTTSAVPAALSAANDSRNSECAAQLSALGLPPLISGSGLIVLLSLIDWSNSNDERLRLFQQTAEKFNLGPQTRLQFSGSDILQHVTRIQSPPYRHLILPTVDCIRSFMEQRSQWRAGLQLVSTLALSAESSAPLAIFETFIEFMTKWEQQASTDSYSRSAYSEYGVTLVTQHVDDTSVQALEENLLNPAISQVILLNNVQINYSKLKNAWKIVQRLVPERLTFAQALRYANTELTGRTVIIGKHCNL